MKTYKTNLPELECSYPFTQISSPDNLVFLDIETTGFTANSSQVYMIGCVIWKDGFFEAHQWFSENPDDEAAMLNSFVSFISDYHFLIHFNGNNFDIPFLNERFRKKGIQYSLADYDGLDIYKRIAPYKTFLKLPNCKQKTLETYLGIDRDDVLSGGELIGVYHDYVKNPTEHELNLLLLHNREDIIGMVQILPILSYIDLLNKPVTVVKVHANYYEDFQGHQQQEIVMKLKLDTPLPIQVSNYSNHCFFTGIGNEATLKVPIYQEEMKYFYSNYRDYYYLPAEDVALHRSVASFVDSSRRVPATASNCYTRKISIFLPQWEPVIAPFFKRNYKDKELFFEITDELKNNRVLFSRYASHVLQVIAGSSSRS